MNDHEDYIYESISEKNWVEKEGWAPELVNTILERLRKSNPSLKKEKKVVVVWSKEINAFAATGDYVYISRALLEKCPNEESAAFIIAHELAHHNLGHLEVPDWAKRFSFLLLLDLMMSPMMSLTKMRHLKRSSLFGFITLELEVFRFVIAESICFRN